MQVLQHQLMHVQCIPTADFSLLFLGTGCVHSLHLWCKCFVREKVNSTLSQLCARCSISALQRTFFLQLKLPDILFRLYAFGCKAVNFHVKYVTEIQSFAITFSFLDKKMWGLPVLSFSRVKIVHAHEFDIFFVIYTYKVPSSGVKPKKKK